MKHLFAILLAVLLIAACTGEATRSQSQVEGVLDRNEQLLLSIKGVVGVGIQDIAGETVIAVYVKDESVEQQVPRELEGVKVEILVSGELWNMNEGFDEPNAKELDDGTVAVPSLGAEEEPSESEAERVLSKHEQRLLSIEGVEAIGIQSNVEGLHVIAVYVRDRSATKRVPETLDGIPVEVLVSGLFKAQ